MQGIAQARATDLDQDPWDLQEERRLTQRQSAVTRCVSINLDLTSSFSRRILVEGLGKGSEAKLNKIMVRLVAIMVGRLVRRTLSARLLASRSPPWKCARRSQRLLG